MLGIAGGNGLDRIDASLTKRVVGLDINTSYLEEVRRCYVRMSGLELACVDLAQQTVHLEPVQLMHAALVSEHAGVSRCLENALSLVAPGGFSLITPTRSIWLAMFLTLISASDPTYIPVLDG